MKAERQCAGCSVRPSEDKERRFISFKQKVILCAPCIEAAHDVVKELRRLKAQKVIRGGEE